MNLDLTLLLMLSCVASTLAVNDAIPTNVVCKRITLTYDYMTPSTFSFIVSFNSNTNHVNAVFSTDTNSSYVLSNFNSPDNQFSASQPYLDSSGLSFISPSFDAFKCSTATCLYNLYFLDQYYLAYSSISIFGPVQTIIVHPFVSDSLCPTSVPPSFPPSPPQPPPLAELSYEPTMTDTSQKPSINSQTKQSSLPSLLPELLNNPSISFRGPTCRQVIVTSLYSSAQLLAIIVLYNPVTNNVISIYSNDSTTQYPLSDFNTADNAFYSTQPYVDSFGLSFQAPKFPGFDCAASTCDYNIYSNPTYYITFSNENSQGQTNSMGAIQVNSTNCPGLHGWNSAVPSITPSASQSSAKSSLKPNRAPSRPFRPTIEPTIHMEPSSPSTNPAFTSTACTLITLKSSTSSVLPISFKVYFDAITYNVVEVLASDASTQYSLSEFNFADNYFFPDEPYFDNFGLSFLAPAIDGYNCLADSCAYNIYYLGMYYISFAVSTGLVPLESIALTITTDSCSISGTTNYSSPTSLPIIGPTLASTLEPSSRPTLKPSVLQSLEPTNFATDKPSEQLVLPLTHQPFSTTTQSPVHTTVTKPTTTPTQSTIDLSFAPSLQPSPSTNPFVQTSAEPSSEKIGQIVEPSQYTIQPSRSPISLEPSKQTLINPSNPPNESSQMPFSSISMKPSGNSLWKPSIEPLTQFAPTHPTVNPSPLPLESPTEIPIVQPIAPQFSVEPSYSQITAEPTLEQASHSLAPTSEPSTSPTRRQKRASIFPSKFQSSTPQPQSGLSITPSLSPSDASLQKGSYSMPSSSPATSPPQSQPILLPPTNLLSSRPSAVPENAQIVSTKPSVTPSITPVLKYSFPPSHFTFSKTTLAPSYAPIIAIESSLPPSFPPSNVPTVKKLLSPSPPPSFKPSSVPSSIPTVLMKSSYSPSSTSPMATSFTSNSPSTLFSVTPTLPSAWPTDGPMHLPYHAPTSSPSGTSNRVPSVHPIVLPPSIPSTPTTSIPTIPPNEAPLTTHSTSPLTLPSSVLPTISLKPSYALGAPTRPPALISPFRCPPRDPIDIAGYVSSQLSIVQVIQGISASQLIQTGANITFAQTVKCMLHRSHTSIPLQVTVISISPFSASVTAIRYAASIGDSLTSIDYMIQYWSPTISLLNTDYEDIISTLNTSSNDGTLLQLFNAYCNDCTSTATAYSPPKFLATTSSPSLIPIAAPSVPFPAQTSHTSTGFVQANLPLIVALSVLAATCVALFCVLIIFTSYKRKEKQKEELNRRRGQSIISVDSADSMDLHTIYTGAGAKESPKKANSSSGSEDGVSIAGTDEHNLGNAMPLPSPATVWRPRSMSTDTIRSRSVEGVHVPGGNEAWARRARALSSTSLRISQSRGKSVTKNPASGTAKLQPQFLMELPDIIKVTEEGSGNWARRSQWSAEESVAEPCFLSFPSREEDDHNSDPEIGSSFGQEIHHRDSESDSLSSLSYGLNSDIA